VAESSLPPLGPADKPGSNAHAEALGCLGGGISIIPVRADGSKAPALPSWDLYKNRLPTEAEITSWFSRGGVGLAVVCGHVSGNLGVLDVEFLDVFRDFSELVEAQAPGLVPSLPLVATPGKDAAGGRHLYFRSRSPLKTGKLARLTEEEALRRTGDRKRQTAIELKAEGGYVLAPGCPAACHESGRLYRHVGGPFPAEVPTLPDEDVQLLLSCARALNRLVAAPARPATPRGAGAAGSSRPGDDFNRRASWPAVLGPHGWALVRVRQGVSYWRRPGKEKGVSATTGYCTSEQSGDLLCVFSSNAAPLEIPDGRDHCCFSKFAAYALLYHKGNFPEATRELARQGYGGPPRPTRRAGHHQLTHIHVEVEV
jgi:putative DNA primase/helicase